MTDHASRTIALRQELKVWEKSFQSEHGRKPARDDIKTNATIAAKYKEYNKLSRSAPEKVTQNVHSTPKKAPKRRPAEPAEELSKTPTKKQRTPEKPVTTPAHIRAFIGPTPQKDGFVLGIFDMLPPAETPSRANKAALSELPFNVVATPRNRKRGTAGGEADDDSENTLHARHLSHTPESASKRFLLDSFVTPVKRKRGEEGTPSSSMKGLATPSFLRRDVPLEAVVEEDEKSPRVIQPWKKVGLVRTLSSMIQGLKKQKEEEVKRQEEAIKQREEEMEEEMEILREMEAGTVAMPVKKAAELKVLVEDSQPAMRLGPDTLESEPEGEDRADGDDGKEASQPRKVWKKKGQKRQTRRAILRPVRAKPKPHPEPSSLGKGSAGDHEQSPKADSGYGECSDVENDQHQDDDDDYSDYSNSSHTPKKRRVQAGKESKGAPKKVEVAPVAKEGVIKRTVKKISAQAHANYCKLKIKNKNSKANGRGRFGRGRR